MADVKKCDRCGALIDYKSYHTQHRIFKQSTILRSLLRLKCEDTMFIYDYDLCRDCSAKLKEFLKGEELVSDAAEHPIFGRLVNAE